VAERVPVYAGASEITTRDCIATARIAEEIGGVAGLSVLTSTTKPLSFAACLRFLSVTFTPCTLPALLALPVLPPLLLPQATRLNANTKANFILTKFLIFISILKIIMLLSSFILFNGAKKVYKNFPC
jgi:hypothetical protein